MLFLNTSWFYNQRVNKHCLKMPALSLVITASCTPLAEQHPNVTPVPPSLPTSRNYHFCLKREQPSAHLSNSVYATHCTQSQQHWSWWTLHMLCGVMAEAYSMKLRPDKPYVLFSCWTTCNCEWIILEFCQILTYSHSINLILDGGSNCTPSRLPLLTLL
jgi:hypothetical protein